MCKKSFRLTVKKVSTIPVGNTYMAPMMLGRFKLQYTHIQILVQTYISYSINHTQKV